MMFAGYFLEGQTLGVILLLLNLLHQPVGQIGGFKKKNGWNLMINFLGGMIYVEGNIP